MLSGFSKALINTIRGIPILVQLFYIYFVFPEIGIQLSAFEAGVIGLGFAYSCYMAEVFRSGIEGVDPGQVEAAQSLGMSRVQDPLARGAAAGLQDRAAAVRQHLRDAAEGHVAGLDHHRGRAARSRAS